MCGRQKLTPEDVREVVDEAAAHFRQKEDELKAAGKSLPERPGIDGETLNSSVTF